MRKYLATAIQVMALPKYQLNWVAEHLGHNLEIHKKYYRQSIDTVETAKLTKLMFLADHGKMDDVRGMNLDTIDTYLSKDELFNHVHLADYEVRKRNILILSIIIVYRTSS